MTLVTIRGYRNMVLKMDDLNLCIVYHWIVIRGTMRENYVMQQKIVTLLAGFQ